MLAARLATGNVTVVLAQRWDFGNQDDRPALSEIAEVRIQQSEVKMVNRNVLPKFAF
jgi:hypothetical protein